MANDSQINTVSSDFWEPDEFDILKNQLEAYIAHKKEKELKIWVPKCDTGEEAYIIGIALHEILDKDISKYQILIFATDDNENELIKAKKGVYDLKSLEELDPDLLDKYFIKKGNHFEISKTIRQSIFFSYHEITQDPLIEKFDLISCRGLYTYAGEDRIKEFISIFGDALNTNGILFPNIPNYSDNTTRVKLGKEDLSMKTCNNNGASWKKCIKETNNSNNYEFCLNNLIENSVLLAVTDTDGKLKYISPAACDLLGSSVQKLSGESFYRLVHKDDQNKAINIFNDAQEDQNKKVYLQIRLINDNGACVWIEGEVINLLNLYEVEGVAIKFRNITHWKKIEEDLHKEQSLLRTLIDHIPDSIFAMDANSRYILSNRAVLNSLGIESEEKIIGKTAIEIFGPSAKPLMENSKRILEGGEPTINQEHPIFIKEKQVTRWVRTSVVPFRNDQDVIDGLVGISRDITEMKEADERLHQSLEQQDLIVRRLTTILNTLPANIVVLNEYGNIIEFNDSWRKRAEENGILQKDYGLGSNHPKMLENRGTEVSLEMAYSIRRILSGEKDHYMMDFPYPGKTKNKWYRILAQAIKSEKSKGAVIMYIDITPLKLAEEKTQEVNERFRLAGRATNDAIWDWNFQNNEVIWGEGFDRIFGYKYDGKPQPVKSWKDHIHPEDRERVIKGINAAIDNPLTNYWEDEYRFLRGNNKVAYVHDRGYIIWDDNHNPIRMVGAMHDITERKKDEKDNKKMIEDLIQRNRDLEQFAYITSHNLRAPVSNIIALSKLLKDEKRANGNRKVFINSIHDSVNALDGVISDLNQILKTKREVTENKILVLFDDLAEEVKDGLSAIIEKESACIETNFSEINEILTLKSYLFSIFHNIISNSIKYRRPEISPKIIIKCYKSGTDKVMITFEDNGLGIDLNAKGDQVFGMYKRFHHHIEGKGIGLFMVKTQVETLGGKINIESEVNVGTKFTLELPL